ncbi:hypothetical protein OHR68_43100 [Spirillospora sp. NBC_00431]
MSVARYARTRLAWRPARAAVKELMRRFGVVAWFGATTGMWWAMVDGECLVEATDPDALVEQIVSARRPR